jgi:hypothetical protein
MESHSTFVPVSAKSAPRRLRLADFQPRAISWLALAPAWPADLARRGFPSQHDSVAVGDLAIETLNGIVSAGLAEVVEKDFVNAFGPPTGNRQVHFTEMPTSRQLGFGDVPTVVSWSPRSAPDYGTKAIVGAFVAHSTRPDVAPFVPSSRHVP